MQYLSIIFIVGIGVLAGVFLANYLAERKVKTAPAPATPEPSETSPSQAAKRRFWLGGNKPTDQVKLFQTWAQAKLESPEVRTWLASLTNEQVSALIEQLDSFCHNLGFDLAWLTSESLHKTPELESKAITVVEHYCNACLEAANAQVGFQQFRQLLDLVEQPFSRENKAVAQQLYPELVRRDIVPAMTPDLMVAAEQARQQAIAAALKDAAATNWTALMDVFTTLKTQHDPAAHAKVSWNQRLRKPFGARGAEEAQPSSNGSEPAPVA